MPHVLTEHDRHVLAKLLSKSAQIRAFAKRAGPREAQSLEVQASAYEHSASIVFGGESEMSDPDFISLKDHVYEVLWEFGGEVGLCFRNYYDILKIAEKSTNPHPSPQPVSGPVHEDVHDPVEDPVQPVDTLKGDFFAND